MRKKWNILIVPNTSEQGYSIAFSSSTIKAGLLLLSLLLIGASISFATSWRTWKNNNPSRVSSVMNELQAKQDELNASRSELSTIKKEFDDLLKVEAELRSLAGLKPREKPSADIASGGQGGPEYVDTLAANESAPNFPLQLVSDSRYGSEDPFLQTIAETRASFVEIRKSFLVQQRRKEEQMQLLCSIPSINPVSSRSAWISSPFGYRKDPIDGRTAFHDGLDIVAARRTPIRAPADGIVMFSGWQEGLGCSLEIKHRFGYSTTYGHLDKLLVKRGDHVKRGDFIALLGNTGRSTGPHLHYEIRLKGRLINPSRYLAIANATALNTIAKLQ